MTPDEEGVTLHEVNRNVIDIRRQIEQFGAYYVPMNVYQENNRRVEDWRLEQGRRIGALENETAERRKSFTNSFMYPLLIAVLVAGITFAITKGFGG